MTDGYIIDLVRQAIYIMFLISAPIMILGVIVGLIIAILQTTTSIQEQTLTFVPKLFVILGALVYFSFFILSKLTDYAKNLFESIPQIVNL